MTINRSIADLLRSHATIPTAAAAAAPGTNLLLNGGFTVAQRSSVTGIGGTNYTYYGTDGWCHYGTSSAGRYTASQATAGTTDGPFRYCLQIDVTTADADTSGNNISAVLQKMEGQNLQHLNWGQATDDQPLALSFWVKSPKSGTHCVAVYLQEGNDSCTTEYTVASADTWQYVTVDFPAPGTSVPVIDNDANASLWLVFPLMATGAYQATADAWQEGAEGYATSNQQNLLDNTSNNFFLANVILEVGPTNTASTDFPAEDVGTTLRKCFRYFERQGHEALYTRLGSGVVFSANSFFYIQPYNPKRVAPTITATGTIYANVYGGGSTGTTFGAVNYASEQSALITISGGSGMMVGSCASVGTYDTAGDYISISAEL
jgi:hypothetical protein